MTCLKLWLKYGITLLFARGLLIQAQTLSTTPAEVFESEPVTLSLNFESRTVHYSTWFENSSPVGQVYYNNSQCNIYGLLTNTQLYDVNCNSTNVSITIKNTTRTMNGNVWKAYLESHPYATNIFVNVAVQFVHISTHVPLENRILSLNESDVINIMCRSSYSRPGPSLSLYTSKDKSTETKLSLPIQTSYTTYNASLEQTTTIFVFNATRTWNDWIIFCTASNSPQSEIRSETVNLDIMFPPRNKPFIAYIGKELAYWIKENNTGSMICSIDESNPPAKLSWHCTKQGTVDVTSLNETSLVIKWTAVRNTITLCTCTSTHILTNPAFVSIDIHVLYPPEIIMVNLSTDTTFQANIVSNLSVIKDKNISLICSANGNPVASNYSWSGIASSYSSKLLLTMENGSGFVSCQASNEMKEVPANTTTIGTIMKSYFIQVLYPAFISPMQNSSVIEGRPFNKLCEVIHGNSGNEAVKWITTGQINLSNPNLLVISNVTRGNKGEHSCLVNSTMSPTYGPAEYVLDKTSFFLDVMYYPENLSVSLDIGSINIPNIYTSFSLIENASAQLLLKCSASGNPDPSTYWWSGRQINNSTVLTVAVVKESRGNYTCIATNYMMETTGYSEIGKTNKTYILDILYPPEIEDLSTITTAPPEEGNPFNVSCKVIPGKETQRSISWFRNEGNFQTNTSHLSFPKIMRNDSGTYTCKMTYTLAPTYGGTIKDVKLESFTINVLYRAAISVFYIAKNEQRMTVTVNENERVRLICEVDSNPGSTIELLMNDVLVKNNTLQKKLDYDIQKSNCTHTGTHTCYGFNFLNNGVKSMKSLQLFVTCSPRPLNSMMPLKNITSAQHVPVTFSLNVLAYPVPSFSFYRLNGSTLIPISEGVIENQTLVSPAVSQINITLEQVAESHFGQYILNISNSFGYYQQRFQLIPKDKPNPPLSFNYTDYLVTEHSITFTWIPGFDGGEPQTFIISYSETMISPSVWRNSSSVNANGAENYNYTVHHLWSQTSYVFTIYAENILGSSRYPDLVTVTTKEQVLSSQDPNPSIAGPVAGGVVGGGVLALLVILAIVFIIHKRRPNGSKKLDEAKSHIYQNMNITQESKQEQRLPPLPPSEEEVSNKISSQEMVNAFKEQADPTYLNTMELTNIIQQISVSEIFTYVSSKPLDEFLEEFEKFPKGMIESIPYTVARRPENAALNRYQGIYPYDHSRVIIENRPEIFINANFIDGFEKRRTYIASLGPTVKHTVGFTTFWNMVWYEKSDIIVMLTNLSEPSGMKCEKYWAENGKSREIGDFTIQSLGEEIAAEYTVRTCTVYKGEESRLVTQLHYTAWPDKKVPEDVTSLIEFRQRVKAAPTRSLGPVVVHCRYPFIHLDEEEQCMLNFLLKEISGLTEARIQCAGIGRTGTYIALDRLIEEGRATNAVNVYDCVMNMRKQRVNMVQTLDQYVYLHQALVYCIAFDVEPITADEIDEYIQTTSNNVFSKLFQLYFDGKKINGIRTIFQQLQQSVEQESAEETEARLRNGDLVDKNRRRADIPGDAHRIRVFLDKEMGELDYINAVYFNAFKRLEHFILAQSPLPNTLYDFVCMLYQEKCCCIVSLDDYLQTGTNNVAYLPPENQPAIYGNFTISSITLDSKSSYTVRKLKIGHSGQFERGERVAYHFEFAGWKHDESIPRDPFMFVDFVMEVDEYATQFLEENSHVLVHCMTGSARSGLFCAVSNLIQKMGQERQVSIVNTIRQIRARRKTAIPNMEQLKFSYIAVDAFVKSYSI